ncbi:hypothetical protein A2160_05555, partial [Candidatus Beckwithbacteria bacterium RBG_13_42_9]
TKQSLGFLGEQLAKKLLLNKGYRFLDQNFHCRYGEIDLIFQDKETIVFVEVKTRFSDQLSLPEEAITPRKIGSIIKTTDYYYLLHPNLPKLARIDAVAIQIDENTEKVKYIKHFQNITG